MIRSGPRFAPSVHAGLPSGALTMVVAFDEPLRLTGEFREGGGDTYWGLLGGLHATPALIHHSGRQHGVQLAITPQGAPALFGVSAGELASTVVRLEQVVPGVADELVDRLATAATWRARWAVLDHILLRLLCDTASLAPELEHAWDVLRASAGTVAIAELAGTVGWSRRHLAHQFRRQFGLAPKLMGRVLRFEHAQRLLRLPTQPSLASIAATCGYADQAHLTREWREFAGSSPTEWLASESIPFLQDEDGSPTS